MTAYEVTFIVRHDMSPADVQTLSKDTQKTITDLGGKVLKDEYWGLRTLAYKINKAAKGHYVFLGIECDYAALREMERQLSINEDVVRQLTVKVDAIDDKPSPVMKNKSGDYEDAAA
jgi:small subunit ribosomal protein S6